MILSNLTTGGWVIFGLMVFFDVRLFYETLAFVYRAIAVAKGFKVKEFEISLLAPVVFTIWFLYLIS